MRLEKPYLNRKDKVIAINTPLEPVLKETTSKTNTKKVSNLVLCVLFKNKTPNAIVVNEESILGFQTIPLYLPENIFGLKINPTNTTNTINKAK